MIGFCVSVLVAISLCSYGVCRFVAQGAVLGSSWPNRCPFVSASAAFQLMLGSLG